MCGRFSQSQSASAIAQAFALSQVPTLQPRYNIAPTQLVSAVIVEADSATRQFREFRWGLIPSWSKDPAIGARLINARSETVAEKSAFRTSFRRRRCLIPADGFYEWQRQAGKKQPFYFCLDQHQPFAFAGLWDHWEGADGSVIQSCTILTTEANERVRPIHDRMPVILAKEHYDQWLDPQPPPVDRLRSLLSPYPSEVMDHYVVGLIVNSPKNDRVECIEPIALEVPS